MSLGRLTRDGLTGAGSDTSKPGHHSLDGSDDRWFPEEDDVERCPDEEARGSADVRVEDCHGGGDIGRVGGTAVEP